MVLPHLYKAINVDQANVSHLFRTVKEKPQYALLVKKITWTISIDCEITTEDAFGLHYIVFSPTIHAKQLEAAISLLSYCKAAQELVIQPFMRIKRLQKEIPADIPYCEQSLSLSFLPTTSQLRYLRLDQINRITYHQAVEIKQPDLDHCQLENDQVWPLLNHFTRNNSLTTLSLVNVDFTSYLGFGRIWPGVEQVECRSLKKGEESMKALNKLLKDCPDLNSLHLDCGAWPKSSWKRIYALILKKRPMFQITRLRLDDFSMISSHSITLATLFPFLQDLYLGVQLPFGSARSLALELKTLFASSLPYTHLKTIEISTDSTFLLKDACLACLAPFLNRDAFPSLARLSLNLRLNSQHMERGLHLNLKTLPHTYLPACDQVVRGGWNGWRLNMVYDALREDFDRLIMTAPEGLDVEYRFGRKSLNGSNGLKMLRWRGKGEVQVGWW